MDNQTGERVIHSYDTERRKVLCGVPEQTNSTKHAAAVTCTTCRELLRTRRERQESSFSDQGSHGL